MSWWVYCIIPAFLWSVVNLVDQHLARKYFENNAIGFQATIGLFSFISGAIVLALSENSVPVEKAFIFISSGILLNLSFVPYIKALQQDEASIVVPLFQLAPVCTIIFSWIFLNETLTTKQLLGILLIIFSSIGITYDFSTYKIKLSTLFLMIISCTGIGIFTTISRYFVQETHWLPVAGYTMIGAGFVSLIIFSFDRKSLKNSLSLFKINGFNLVVFFIAVEFLARSAMVLFQKALSVAPSAGHVHTIIDGIKPFIVYGIIFLFGAFIPKTIEKTSINKTFIFQISCISFMAFGLYLLLIEK